MADRYSERTGRWEGEERRHPHDARSRERDWSRDRDREWQQGGHDRGFVERAGDEVRSWFGDEEAQRRRMRDERDEPSRARGDWGGREGRERSDWSREPVDRDWSRQWGYVEGRGGGYGDRSSEWASRGYGSTGYGYSGQSGYGGSGTWGRQRDWDREPRWGGQGPGGFGSYERESDRSRRGDWARYAGLESARERDPMTGPHYGRGPRNYQRSDERIREDLCERLSQHSYLDPSDVEVRVESGEVTLQGNVDDRWAKRTIEEIAETVWGVKEVHNQLRITQSAMGQERERGIQPPSQSPQRGNWAA